MSDRELHCYDYVNQPYPRVRDALISDPLRVFRHATAAAAPAPALHVRVGGLDIGTDIAIQIVGVEHDQAYDRPATKLTLEWQAASTPRMFPAMKATLVIFALSPTETQLELRGTYQPPMGKLGEVIDAAAGHRLAEASVTRFLQEVAGWLREALASPSPAPSPPIEARLAREELAVPSLIPTGDAKPRSQPGTAVDTEC
jgi:hypothetical protein